MHLTYSVGTGNCDGIGKENSPSHRTQRGISGFLEMDHTVWLLIFFFFGHVN